MEREKGCIRVNDLLFLWIAIVLLGVQGVSGFSVSTVSVNPSGDLKDGAPVIVTCEIPRTGILLYDQLVITTDLDNPRWDPVVVVRDQEIPVNPASTSGNTLILNGAVYNYPSAVPAKVRVTMKGTVPDNHTTSQRLLNIRQLDAEGTEYAYPSGYILPMPGSPPLPLHETDMIPAKPAKNPATENSVPATLRPVPVDSSPVTTTRAPEKTVSVPTALPASTPKAARPAEPLLIFGAVGITVYWRGKNPAGKTIQLTKKTRV
jgi:hypothetical protein